MVGRADVGSELSAAPYGEIEGAPLKGRTEFAARRRQKNQIIFHRGMYVGKHSSQARSSGILPLATKLCTRQTWGLLAEKRRLFARDNERAVPKWDSPF